MSKAAKNNWYARISRIFKSPTSVKRRVRDYRQPPTSTALELFSKTQSFIYSNAINAYGQYDRLSRYADFCFRGDTLIYTTKGIHTIKELSEGVLGARFHVYSYDHETKRIVIANAHNPRIAKSGKASSLVRVTFDDGGHVDVTPDHRMMLRDGSYIEAQHLKADTALMPFYVRSLTEDGYRMVYTMDKNRWKGGWLSEHIMVAEALIRPLEENEVVHHKDFNPSNNLVENLEIMTEVDHQRYHSKLNNRKKFGVANQSHSKWMHENNPVSRKDVTYEKILDLASELDFSMRKVREKLSVDANVIKRRLRKHGFKNWVDFSARRDEAQNARTHSVIVSETRSPEIEEIVAIAHECADIYQLASRLSCTENAIRRRLHSHGHGTWSEFRFGKCFENKKSADPAYDDSVTYQGVCDVYTAGMTYNQIAAALDTSANKVLTRIMNEGYESFSQWEDSYQNHKVASIEFLEEDDIVYNVTVEKYHNLAVGSLNPSMRKGEKTIREHSMIIASQSEMEYTPEISAALDIYADEAVSQDEKGNVLHIHSENRKIRSLLEELFYDTLNIDFNLRMWVRNLVKYGDFFLFNDVAPGFGVLQVFPVPVNEVEREEGFDPEDPQAIRFRWVTQGNVALENWQMTHFRMLGNDAFLPYGSSVIEPARRIWRQLILIEDAMMVYRVVRSPERRVFYIDVGGVPPEEVENYMKQQEAKLRSNTIIDRSTGRVDLRYNPLSVDEDYFVPRRGAEGGTEITSLSGGQHVSATEDVEYIQKKLFAALKIPRAYLGYDEMLSSKATLAAEDIRFSRTVQAIQKVITAELQMLAYVHLFLNGYEGEDMFDFELRLNNPSTIAQQQKLELYNRKFEIIGNALGIADGQVFSQQYLLRTLMDMSEQTQKELAEEVVEDIQRRAALTKISEGAVPESVGFGGPGGGFEGGNFDMPDEGLDDVEGGDDFDGGDLDLGDDDSGGDDTGGEDDLFAGQVKAGEVLGEADPLKADDEKKPSLTDSNDDRPINVSPEMKKKQYNRSRHRRHGAEAMVTPDFGKMTSIIDDPQQDPFGDPLESPFKNALSIKLERMHPRDPARKMLEEQMTALAELDSYLIGADDDRSPAAPRVTGALQSVLDHLEAEFGPELAEMRSGGGNGDDGLLTENIDAVDLAEQLIDEPDSASDVDKGPSNWTLDETSNFAVDVDLDLPED